MILTVLTSTGLTPTVALSSLFRLIGEISDWKFLFTVSTNKGGGTRTLTPFGT